MFSFLSVKCWEVRLLGRLCLTLHVFVSGYSILHSYCSVCEFQVLYILANTWYCQKSLSFKNACFCILKAGDTRCLCKANFKSEILLTSEKSTDGLCGSHWGWGEKQRMLCFCFSGTELPAAMTGIPWLQTSVKDPPSGRGEVIYCLPRGSTEPHYQPERWLFPHI